MSDKAKNVKSTKPTLENEMTRGQKLAGMSPVQYRLQTSQLAA